MLYIFKIIGACLPATVEEAGGKLVVGLMATLMLVLAGYSFVEYEINTHVEAATKALSVQYDKKIAAANAQHEEDLKQITNANTEVLLAQTTLSNNQKVMEHEKATVTEDNVKLVNDNTILKNNLSKIKQDPRLNEQEKDTQMSETIIDDINNEHCEITEICEVNHVE
jgi:hypothetical protein